MALIPLNIITIPISVFAILGFTENCARRVAIFNFVPIELKS